MTYIIWKYFLNTFFVIFRCHIHGKKKKSMLYHTPASLRQASIQAILSHDRIQTCPTAILSNIWPNNFRLLEQKARLALCVTEGSVVAPASCSSPPASSPSPPAAPPGPRCPRPASPPNRRRRGSRGLPYWEVASLPLRGSINAGTGRGPSGAEAKPSSHPDGREEEEKICNGGAEAKPSSHQATLTFWGDKHVDSFYYSNIEHE